MITGTRQQIQMPPVLQEKDEVFFIDQIQGKSLVVFSKGLLIWFFIG